MNFVVELGQVCEYHWYCKAQCTTRLPLFMSSVCSYCCLYW